MMNTGRLLRVANRILRDHDGLIPTVMVVAMPKEEIARISEAVEMLREKRGEEEIERARRRAPGSGLKLLLAGLLLAGCSYAQEMPKDQLGIAVYRASAAAVIGANMADLVSSLNAPGHETNPLIGQSKGSLVAFKIGPPAIALGVEWLILRHHPHSRTALRVASILNFAMAAGPSYAAVHNWRLDRGTQAK